MSNTLRGLVPLIPFVVVNAATDVYGGNKTQSISPITLAAVSFTFAVVLFFGLDAGRHGATKALRPFRTHRRDVIAINVMTAITWLTLLSALKYLEPAVVNVVTFAIGPACAVLLGPLVRRGSTVLATELVVAAGIFVLIGVLSWGSFAGLSGIGHVGDGQAALGLTLGVICGLAYTGTILYSKRLSDDGLSPLSSLAVRYPMTVLMAWVLVAFIGPANIGAALLPGLVIAVVSIGLTNYLGQVGIKYVEPITASLLDTLSPVFVLLLQLFDGRLHPSGLTIGCVLGITVLVGIGVAARSQLESRSTREALSVLAAEGVTDPGAQAA
jgi:drug/metabolite transporter (DMT)-like permease